MKSIRFLTSFMDEKEAPQDDTPEVVMLGHSNAGKSSFINGVSDKKVAHVGQTPGKTRTLNLFDVDGKYRLVDVPGYGYAARSHKERDQWGASIESFLTHRKNLVVFVLIMDIKRDWSESEEMLFQLSKERHCDFLLFLNKKDKLKKNEVLKKIQNFQSDFGDQVFAISCKDKKDLVEAEKVLFSTVSAHF